MFSLIHYSLACFLSISDVIAIKINESICRFANLDPSNDFELFFNALMLAHVLFLFGFRLLYLAVPVNDLFDDLLNDLCSNWPVLQLSDLQAILLNLGLELRNFKLELFDLQDVGLIDIPQLNDLLVNLNPHQLI